jgi:hypothetical protein
MKHALTLSFMALSTLITACGDPNCEEQTCADFGGSGDKVFLTCVASGEGSVDDEFYLKDDNGAEFYTCTRPADDNEQCGVELILAKEEFCTE